MKPKNQIVIPGTFRQSRLSDAEILEFRLDLGIFQLDFRIPIAEESDRVPVYVRYRVGQPDVNFKALRPDGPPED